MRLLPLLLLMLTAFSCSAKPLWSDFSLTLLKGNNYEVGDNKRTVLTFEHAAAYNWGDSFLFIDRLQSDNGDKATYMEISPRFKFSQYKNSVFENFYVATTAEIGDGFTHYLIGLGTKLKIPSFNFFNVNLYHRNNNSSHNSKQATLSWAVPIGPFIYDGFLDYVIPTSNNSSSVNMTSQLKYNLGAHFHNNTKLYVGIEYVYWKNKFSINGVDEKNMNLLVKYHF